MNTAPARDERLAREVLELRGQVGLLELQVGEAGATREIARLRLVAMDAFRTVWQEATGTPLPPDIHGRFWIGMEHRGALTMKDSTEANRRGRVAC